MIKRARKKRKAPRFNYGTECDICGAKSTKTKKVDLWSYSKKGKIQTRCKKHLRRP